MARYPSPKRHEWIQPLMRKYRMACCDCGLVHELRFRVMIVKARKDWKKGDSPWAVLLQRVIPHRVQFQAARHERATAAVRRKFETIRVVKGPKSKGRSRDSTPVR